LGSNPQQNAGNHKRSYLKIIRALPEKTSWMGAKKVVPKVSASRRKKFPVANLKQSGKGGGHLLGKGPTGREGTNHTAKTGRFEFVRGAFGGLFRAPARKKKKRGSHRRTGMDTRWVQLDIAPNGKGGFIHPPRIKKKKGVGFTNP